MAPALVVPLLAIVSGGVTYLFIRRWPHRDPGAPHVAPAQVVGEVARHPRLRAFLLSRLDPASETGLLLTAAVVALVLSVSAFGVVVEMVRANRGLAVWDEAFARWGATHASPSSTRVLRAVSQLGGYPVVTVLSVGIAVHEYRRGLQRSVAPLLVLVVGGQFAVSNAIKYIVDRARPDFSQLTGFAGTSFPSGHASAAAASYAVFALILGRRRSPRTKAVLGACAVGIALSVASTRVLLGVHWFTDVVAGVFIGWAWFTALSLAFGGRVMRFASPVRHAEEVARRIDAATTPSPGA